MSMITRSDDYKFNASCNMIRLWVIKVDIKLGAHVVFLKITFIR